MTPGRKAEIKPGAFLAALLLCLAVEPVSVALAAPTVIHSADASFRVERVATGLRVPWGLAILPGNRAVVSENAAGRLTLVDIATGALEPLTGGPNDVFVQANAGMLDVLAHPDFANSGWIYYAYTAGEEALNTTVVERARLDGTALVARERLFEAQPWFHGDIVYGCRLAFRDGYLYITMGDRWDLRHLAQSVGSHVGKILRLHEDGRVPGDNPFVDMPGAEAAVWSYGHRNPQGLAVNALTGDLWSHEHGPRGGDEVNRIERGHNYGWPLVSRGREYSGDRVDPGRKGSKGRYDAARLTGPIHYWVPSIAPSGMVFYDGDAFPDWRGNLFIGALAGTHINRLVLDGMSVVTEERLLGSEGRRVRFVEQGPDGYLYFGGDDGEILRLVPAD